MKNEEILDTLLVINGVTQELGRYFRTEETRQNNVRKVLPSISKQYIVETLMGLDFTYDSALPQDWVNQLTKDMKPYGISGEDIVSGFVWAYDEKAGIGGRPFPISDAGITCLAILKQVPGR